MSGGSMNYLYSKVDDAEFRLDSPLRRAFKEHLKLVSVALRAIEWNDSGDGDSSEDDAIKACLPDDMRLKQAASEAKVTVTELSKVLSDLKKQSRSTWTVEGPS